jgi:hypothetical protein
MRAVRTARRVPASFKRLLVEEDWRLAGDDVTFKYERWKPFLPPIPAGLRLRILSADLLQLISI